MILLAIDATGEHGSIALAGTKGVIEEVALHSPEGFAHILFGEIDALLKRNMLAIGELDGFAAASGPGSFTGVRIGLTAAKGLADATDRKVVAVSNLRALASFGSAGRRAAVTDARRGEIYGAVYDSALELSADEIVAPLDQWLAGVLHGAQAGTHTRDLEFITQGKAMQEKLRAAVHGTPVIQAPLALAGAIGLIAIRDFEKGLAQDPALIDANYVRRSDAELSWREPEPRR